jgi:hypothetical protein
MLWEAFKAFGSLSDARVMKDGTGQRSRGFGFVAFRDHAVCLSLFILFPPPPIESLSCLAVSYVSSDVLDLLLVMLLRSITRVDDRYWSIRYFVLL